MNNQRGYTDSMQVPEKIGGQGRNRTIDTRIFSYHSGNEVTPRSAKRNRKRESCLSGVIWQAEDGSFRVFHGPFATPFTSSGVAE